MCNYPNCRIIIGGDFNAVINHNNSDPGYKFLDCFMMECNLHSMFETRGQQSTYYNEALKCASNIDYFLVNDIDIVTHFAVLHPYLNFSDHRPITVNCKCCLHKCYNRKGGHGSDSSNNKFNVCQLRWDHANLAAYRSFTGYHLQ